METLNNNKNKNLSARRPGTHDTASAGRPQMNDNNDDNEFATPPLKASFSVESNRSTDRDKKPAATDASSNAAATGSADKVDESTLTSVTKLEQKLEAKMDDLADLIYKTGEKIQRLGEALCRIGDKVEQIPKTHLNHRRNTN